MSTATADRKRRGKSLAEVLALDVTTDLVTAGKCFGFGRSKSYALAREGAFPVPVLRIGNEFRVTRQSLLASLGIDETEVRG